MYNSKKNSETTVITKKAGIGSRLLNSYFGFKLSNCAVQTDPFHLIRELITIGCETLIFQTLTIWSNKNHSLKYLRSTTPGC